MERNCTIVADVLSMVFPPIVDLKEPTLEGAFRWMMKYHHVAKVASRLQMNNLLGPLYSYWLADEPFNNKDFDAEREDFFGTAKFVINDKMGK